MFSAGGSGGINGSIVTDNIFATSAQHSAAFINPAFMTYEDQMALHLGYASFLTNASQISYFNFILPYYLNHTLGLSRIGYDNDIEEAVADPTQGTGVKTGNSLTFSDDAYLLSLGTKVLPFLSVGGNVSLVHQKRFYGPNFYGMGIDLGIALNPLYHFRSGYFELGTTLQNAWAPALGSAEKVPMALRVTSYYGLFNQKMEGAVDIVIEDLLPSAGNYSESTNTSPGDTNDVLLDFIPKKISRNLKYNVELQYKLADWLDVKTGYNVIRGIQMGFGVNYKRINVFRYLEFDYNLFYGGPSGTTSGISNLFTFVTRFGPTREEALARRIFERVRIAPMNDFNYAMQLYLQKRYWEAAFAFGKVVSLYPYFHKVDVAMYYLGKCFEFLNMNDAAKDIYSTGLKKYTTSDYRSKYLFGKQNVDYKEGNYPSAMANYAYILNVYQGTDVKPDADYIAAQTKYYYDGARAYDEVYNILGQIAQGNSNYLYAQYTMGIICIQQNKLTMAVNHFNNIVNVAPKSPSEEVLIQKAHIILGHILQEQLRLREALNYYNKILPGTKYYDESLLGIAWCYIKGNSMTTALQFSQKIIAETPNSPYTAESYLIQGYAFTLNKDYAQAQDMFNKCIALCKQSGITQGQIESENGQFQGKLRDFKSFQDKLSQVCLKKPTSQMVEQRDALKKDFDVYNQVIDEHDRFMQEVTIQKRFRKTKERLLEDAEYALASAIRLEKSIKKEKVMEKGKEQIEKIEEEEKRLQEELKKLENKK